MQFDILPQDVKKSKEGFTKLKEDNTIKLNSLKKLNYKLRDGEISFEEFLKSQSQIVDEYRIANSLKNEKFKSHSKLLSTKKFLGFDNFQMFLGEFGWAIGFLIYSLTNLITTFFESQFRNKGKLIKHLTFVYIGLFYAYYPFISPFSIDSDYSRTTYSLSMIVCSFTILIALYYIRKFILRNGKLAILVNWVLDIRNDYFQKIAITALSNKNEKDNTIKIIKDFEDRNNRELSKIVE